VKVAVISSGSPDYLIDIVTDGLIRLLGRQNVSLDYNVRGPCGGNYAHLLKGFQGPEPFDIHEADLLIASTRSMAGMRAWKRKTSKKAVVMLDGEDGDQIQADALHESRVYFKREYIKYRSYHAKVKPLPFAAIPEKVEGGAEVKKTVFFSWHPTHPFRAEASAALSALGYPPSSARDKSLYNQDLMNSLIGVSVRGNGWDTYRYWEIPYFGAALLAHRGEMVIPKDFEDGIEAVFFRTVQDLKDKVRRMVEDPALTAEIGKAGRKACLSRHLSTHRAKTVLEEAA
jgi:hypothetical protein